MMNITLLAAQAALADTLAGGNPARRGRMILCLWNVFVIISARVR